MKKLLVVGALAVSIGVGSLIGYADSPNVPNIIPSNIDTNYSTENREEWFKERVKSQREEIQDALKNGKITQEEANIWEKDLDQMEKFHSENGFIPGVCDREGFGMGMMGGMMSRSGRNGRFGRGCGRI
ncbi:hypothetical protein RBU61_12360 [Tissierella sp. MB52-C2]|uniref:hypothetical protein n=1 Tax=Tissierella sp. MB52-C2 TaxID=3070999 RepID=UPI00280B563C|nr:hypothetical protein [Tissierella sp. MB52-C2]WMM23713.1 hypothetical protein RBU61_12360 [Tissierella sp. MB52-C2]